MEHFISSIFIKFNQKIAENSEKLIALSLLLSESKKLKKN